MRESQGEIIDDVFSELSHRNMFITTSGSIVIVKHPSGRDVQLAYIGVPSRGDRANPQSTTVYYSGDGQDPRTKGTSISRGAYEYVPGIIKHSTGLLLESDKDETWVEVKLWG